MGVVLETGIREIFIEESISKDSQILIKIKFLIMDGISTCEIQIPTGFSASFLN